MAVIRSRVMRLVAFILFVVSMFILVACGGYNSMSSSSSQTPAITGNWNVAFAATGSQGTAPPSTTLTVSFNQSGNNITGTVTAVNNPSSSCFPAIAPTGTTFTVTGQVSSASSSNLNLSVAFMSGSSSGTISASGAIAYLSTMANGSFSFATGTSGCTSGAFTMTKIG